MTWASGVLAPMPRSVFVQKPNESEIYRLGGQRSLVTDVAIPPPPDPSPIPTYLGPIGPGDRTPWFTSPSVFTSVYATLATAVDSGEVVVDLLTPDPSQLTIQAGLTTSPIFTLWPGHQVRLGNDAQQASETQVQLISVVLVFPTPLFTYLAFSRLLP